MWPFGLFACFGDTANSIQTIDGIVRQLEHAMEIIPETWGKISTPPMKVDEDK